MIYGMDPAIFIGRVLLVVCAVTATAFPVMYAWAPWYKSPLGMALMLESVTLAFAIWLKLILTFFLKGGPLQFLLWVNVGVLLLMIIATGTLTYVQFWFWLKRISWKE